MNKKLVLLLTLPLLLLGIIGFAGHFFVGAVGSFGLSVSPTKIVFSDISKSPLLTLNVTSIGGFTGAVTVTETVDHTGLSASCTPASGGTVTLASPGSALVNCNLTATAAGNYLFTFTANSAAANPTTQSISVPVTVEEFPLTVVTPVSLNSGTSSSTSLSVSSNFAFGTPADFSISGSPNALSFTTATFGNTTMTLSSFNGFSRTVTLSATPSSPSVSVTLGKTSVNLLGTTAQTFMVVRGTTNGVFNVVVNATSGTIFHTLSIGVNIGGVADFTVSAGTVLVTPNENSAGTSTITISPLNTFTGTVTLTRAISPVTGLTCTILPGSITLGAAQTSTLSCIGAAGSYTVTVTGASGAISHSASVVYIVQVTVAITSTLVGPGPLTGLTVGCPSAIAVLSNGAGAGTCSLSSSSPNKYTVLVLASKTGFPTENRTLIVSVLGFTMSANPNSFTRQNQGALLTSTITVTSVTSFTGSITFDIAPTTGFTATFSPNPATLPAGGTVPTSMKLAVGAAIPGSYTIVVRGNSTVSGGIITSTVNVQVQVVGKICLSDTSVSSGTLGCPSSPYFFSGPFPSTPQISPTQIEIGVYVQGSALMSGISTILTANTTMLTPAGVDITGSILPGASIGGECLNDVIIVGVCSPQDIVANKIGTLEVRMNAGNGLSVPDNATGLLFTAIYNITGLTPTTGISISFQTGCAGTSIPDGTCLAIANGSTQAVPETIQGATFNNNENPTASPTFTIPWAALTSNTLVINVNKGVGATATLTETAENGFPSFAPDIMTFSSVVISQTAGTTFVGPTFSPSTCSTLGATCLETVTFNTGTAGSYSVTILGTYVATDTGCVPCMTTAISDTLVAPVTVQVNVLDVGWTINGNAFGGTQNVYMAKFPAAAGSGPTANSTLLLMTVTSLGGFTGPITFSTGALSGGTTGITTTCTNHCIVYGPTFTLLPGQTVNRFVNFTATGEGKALYTVRLTSGTTIKTSGTISIFVSGFGETPASTTVSVATGGSATDVVTVRNFGNPFPLNAFAGPVSFTAVSTPATGLTVSCPPVTLSTTITSTTSTCTFASATPGTYTVNLLAIGGSNNDMTNSTSITVTVTGDFTIAASPNPVTISSALPARGNSTITVAPLNGFTGTVTLTTPVVPSGITSCLLTMTTIPGASGTSTLSCLANSAGTFNVVVSGTFTSPSGILVHNVTVTYNVSAQVQDFTITAGPTSVTSNAGTAGTSSITITPSGGFTGTVNLSSNSTSTCTLTPASVTSGSGSSTLSCTFPAAGIVHVTVTGTSTSPALSHSVTVTFTIQDFQISASPTSATVNAGAAATSTITITALHGFGGVVNLASNSTACTLTPSSVTGSGSPTLSCTFTSAQLVHVTVTGTSGGLSHSATVTFTVRDFTFSASPTSPTVNAGSAGTSAITVTGLQGFAGVVSLATNSTSCSVAPTSVTGSGSATLSCTFASASTVHVTVTGTSASLSHATTVTFIVQDFSISASPTAVTVNANIAVTSAISLVALNGFAGVVGLTTNSTSCSVAPTSVTGSGSATLSCTFTSAQLVHVTVTGTSGSLSHSASVTYTVEDFTIGASPSTVNVAAGSAGTSTINIAALQGFAGVVNLVSNSTSCALTPMSVTGSGSSTLSCTFSTSNTIIHVTVTGTSASLSHSTTVTYNVGQPPSLTVSANPTSVTVNTNTAGTSTITVTPQNGFTGVVTLTTNSTSCTVSPSSVTTSGSATLSCTFSSAQLVHVTVTGTSGSTTSSATVAYTVRDFTISASPTSITINAGSPGTSAISVTALQGFAGVVSLTTNSTSCSVAPTSVTGSGSSTLSCTFSSTQLVHVTVTGTSGGLSHSTTITFTIQDFALSASPTSVNVSAGSPGTSTITVTGLQGFAGVVSLASNSSTTCTLAPTSVTGSGTSTLSCTFPTPNTMIHVTVTGTSASLSHSTTVTYNVGPAIGFTVSASPASVTVNVNVAGPSTISVTAQGGFNGVVNLAANSTSCSVSPGTVTGSGSPTLSCTFSSAQLVHVTVTGASSGIPSSSATVTYTVQDFTITASPTSVTVNAGAGGTSTITVTALQGFNGVVGLTSNSTACTLAPMSVTGSGSSTVSCTFSTPNTIIHVTVTGASSNLSHSATVTYNVGGTPDFTITAAPSTVSGNANQALTSTITIGALNGFSANVALSSDNAACTLSPTSVSTSGTSTLSCTFISGGTFTVTVTGASGSLSHSATVKFTVAQPDFTITASPSSTTLNVGQLGSSTITITPANGFTGTVSLSVVGTLLLTTNINPTSIAGGSGTATLTFSALHSGNYTATVTGTSGALTHAVTVNIRIADFTVSANPTSISLTKGSSNTSTITVTGLNGFNGNVALVTIVLPSPAFTATVNPATITGSGTSTLTVSSTASTPTGSFTVIVNGTLSFGTGGSISRWTTVTITITAPIDFTISAAPTSVTMNAGSTGVSTITITGQNGFAGQVALTSSISPSTGLVCTLNPATVSGSGTANLSCNGSAGSYTVTVTGTSGSLTHSATIMFNVAPVGLADFTIAAKPTMLTIEQGEENGRSTITLSSLRGFTGTVNLTVTISGNSQSGLRAFLSPRHVMLTVNGTARSLLRIFAGEHTPVGTYILTVTGTSSTLSHSVSITVKVIGGEDPGGELDTSVIHGTDGSVMLTFHEDEGTMTFGRIIFTNFHDAHVLADSLSLIIRVLSNRMFS